MAAAPKPKRPPRLMTVTAAWRLTPNMIRVTLTHPDIAGMPEGIEGANCKLFLPEPGQTAESFAAQLESGPRPAVRTYTVRHLRHGAAEMDIDFVDHGEGGPASAWARRAKPGDPCGFAGPGLAKVTEFHADWYVLAADMSAIPVAAATLEAMPREARGIAVFAVGSDDDRQEIAAPEGVELRWIVQDDLHQPAADLTAEIRAMAPFEGRVQACVAGEHSVIKAIREELLGQRGLHKSDAYISGYWKYGLVEDEHQAMKRAESAA